MHDIDSIEFPMINCDRVAGTANVVTQHGILRRRQVRKVWPDDIVEQVFLDRTERFFTRVNC